MISESAPPACPTCHAPLKKRPKARSKCRACRAVIHIKERPVGGRWLLTEAERALVEAEWEAESERAQVAVPMLSAASGPGGVEAAWRYAAVVGESYRNPDGQSRQEIIRQRARPGDAALLIPDPNNPRHSYAVKVCLATGEQIGYLDREWGTQLQWDTMNGGRHAAIIHRIYGGTLDKPSRGVVLRVASVPDGAADTELAAIVERARTDPDEWDATGGPPGREVTVTIRVNLELAASRARIGEPPRDPTDEAAVAAYRDAILARLAEPEAEKTSHPSTIAVLILAVVALLVVGAVLLKVGW